MSKENPDVIFDASNRWNGYNYQGKLAILFAIKQILEVYDKSLSVDEKIVLHDFQGKTKIAAITANNGG